MQTYLASMDLQDRLKPGDSIFRGRTNAAKLHYKINEGEMIKYMDFFPLPLRQLE